MKIFKRIYRYFFPDFSGVKREQLWIAKQPANRHGYDTLDVLLLRTVTREGIVMTNCPPHTEMSPSVYTIGPVLFLRELVAGYRQTDEAEVISLGFKL